MVGDTSVGSAVPRFVSSQFVGVGEKNRSSGGSRVALTEMGLGVRGKGETKPRPHL
jgi:hypothetical protein